MATLIPSTEIGAGAVGIVRVVFGTVKAVANDGSERILHLGDRVYANELISTSDLSGVSIEFRNGGRVDLGRDSEAMLDSDVYGPTDVDGAELASSIDAAQQAILAGADPAAVLAAPAAGGGGDDLSSAVNPPPVIERIGPQVTPESGFETQGLSPLNTQDLPLQTGFFAQQVGETNAPPTAVDDLVLSNIIDGAAIAIPAFALMANDSDPDNDPLSLVSTQNPQLGSVSSNVDTVEFVPGEVFSGSATKKIESVETRVSNNDSPQSAVEFARSEFGKPDAADMAFIKYQDGSLGSALFHGDIIDISSNDNQSSVIRDEDWIKLDLFAGERIILDIDHGDDGDRDVGFDPNDVDMFLELYDSTASNLLAQNDDALRTVGGDGSVTSGYHANSLDSYLEYQVQQDGTYYIKASAWDNSGFGIVNDEGNYDLWISIENPQYNNPAFDYTIDDGVSGSDSATATISLFDSDTVTGGSASEILVGRDGAGSLLQGQGGDDTLLGGDGPDSLQGGAGSDLLSGGAGDDVYIFQTGEDGSDEISDFQPGADTLDISDLLSGISVDSGNLDSYVQVNGGGELRLDLSGSGDFNSNSIAHLEGVSNGTSVTLLVDTGTTLELVV